MELPVPLQVWANANQPADSLIYKDGYWNQILFVRDVLSSALARNGEEYMAIRESVKVISTHTSKSVLLPVFRIRVDNGAGVSAEFTMRHNFYNWIVSADCSWLVEADFIGLFNPKTRVHPVCCEGFPREAVFGSYEENRRQFTIELPADNYHIFTFFWIFARKELRP
jgi:hypothetical protein